MIWWLSAYEIVNNQIDIPDTVPPGSSLRRATNAEFLEQIPRNQSASIENILKVK